MKTHYKPMADNGALFFQLDYSLENLTAILPAGCSG